MMKSIRSRSSCVTKRRISSSESSKLIDSPFYRFLRQRTSLISEDSTFGLTLVYFGLDSGMGIGLPLGVFRSKNGL